MKIFVDLDGVIVDFVRGALQLHNTFVPMRDVRWNFADQLGIPQRDFWAPMGYDFWAGLPWTKEGPRILQRLNVVAGDNYAFLTSPCQTAGCTDGKREWIKREFGDFGNAMLGRLIVGSCKHMMAHPGALLIDDYDVNVDTFRKHGGNAVLVPRPWNSRAEECNDDGCFDVGTWWRDVLEVLT